MSKGQREMTHEELKYAYMKKVQRVQELEKRLKMHQKRSWFEENEKVVKQNKRYREAINFAIDYLKNSDIRQVQLVVTGLKSALN